MDPGSGLKIAAFSTTRQECEHQPKSDNKSQVCQKQKIWTLLVVLNLTNSLRGLFEHCVNTILDCGGRALSGSATRNCVQFRVKNAKPYE